MKFRTVRSFPARSFRYPRAFSASTPKGPMAGRCATAAANGWTQMFSDHSPDGSGAAEALERGPARPC